MLLSSFVLDWVYSLPIEQQTTTIILLTLFLLELLVGCLQILLIQDWEESIRGY